MAKLCAYLLISNAAPILSEEALNSAYYKTLSLLPHHKRTYLRWQKRGEQICHESNTIVDNDEAINNES